MRYLADEGGDSRYLLALIEGRADELAQLLEADSVGFPRTCAAAGNCDIDDSWPFLVLAPAAYTAGFEKAARIALDRLAPYMELDRETGGPVQRSVPVHTHSVCWCQLWHLDQHADTTGA